MRSVFRTTVGVAAVVVGFLAFASNALAQTPAGSDLVQVVDILNNNQVLTFAMPEPAKEGDPEPFLAAFYGPIAAPNQWILFTEPGTGIASDRLSIRNGFLYFESDPLGALFADLPVNPVATVVELGVLQPVGALFVPNPGAVIPPISVFSDVEVPEPGVIGGALAWAAAVVCGRRRRRAA
jgi:hypothetical protein